MHGGALYYPLRSLGILYCSLAQGILTDDLELHSEAFENPPDQNVILHFCVKPAQSGTASLLFNQL